MDNKKISDTIFSFSRCIEIILSVIIMIAIIIMILPIVYHFISKPFFNITSEQFTEFLGNILTMLIGVEFVKMLARHTAENQLEVLTFAIVRQMVIEHKNMFETLLGVVAIGLIFAVRKYLLSKNTKNE